MVQLWLKSELIKTFWGATRSDILGFDYSLVNMKFLGKLQVLS
jgi:hypothetical protein